jgi:cobalamin biosynthesis protein CbiD
MALPLEAMLDMGDFAGGVLKYLRDHPVERLTIGGGIGKMTKLAQGALDLHSARSSVDVQSLVKILQNLGASDYIVARAAELETANAVLQLAEAGGLGLAGIVAQQARDAAQRVVALAAQDDRRISVWIGTWVEKRRHQSVRIELADEMQRLAGCPALPDCPHRQYVLPHPLGRRRPRHGEAFGDVGLDLRADTEQEPTA